MALWGNKDSKTASGTIAIASTGVVTGTSTAFTTQAKVGNTITAGGVDYTIISITDATTAKVVMGRSNGGGTVTTVSGGTSYALSEKPAFISRSESPSGTSFVAGDSNNVFGVDNTEMTAGGDNTVNIALVQGGAGYVEVPAIAIAAQTVLTIATTAVSTANGTITATAHKLLTGTKLTYSAASSTVLGGLTDATAYYVVYVDANTFKLASSLANAQAGTTITLTGTGNSSQTFTSDAATATATISSGAVNALTLTGVGAIYLTAPAVTVNEPRLTIPTSGITASTDTIAYTAHGQAAGAALVYKNGGGTAAAGLTDGTTYYVATAGRTVNAFEVKAANTTGAVVAPLISGTGGAGTFSCTSGTLSNGDRVTITGTNTGTGTISGYTAPGPVTYKVSAVTGTWPNVTAFTLTTEAGVAITTSQTAAATFTGLTFTGETVVDITGTGNNAQYFSISAGTTATAKTTLGSGSTSGRPAHAGWVRRIVGTGNRAGRVQYETLVAMGTSTGSTGGISGDAADDLVFPDA
jgi:hypothetical protein